MYQKQKVEEGDTWVQLAQGRADARAEEYVPCGHIWQATAAVALWAVEKEPAEQALQVVEAMAWAL